MTSIDKFLPTEIKLSGHTIQSMPWNMVAIGSLYAIIAKQVNPGAEKVLQEQGLQKRWVTIRGNDHNSSAVLVRHPSTDFTMTLINVSIDPFLDDHGVITPDSIASVRNEILDKLDGRPVASCRSSAGANMMADAIFQHTYLLRQAGRKVVMDVTVPYRISGARIAYDVGLNVPGGMDVISSDFHPLGEKDYICPFGPDRLKIRIMPGAKMTYQFEEASFRVASEGWRDLIAIYDYEGRVIDFAFRLP